MVSFFIKVAGLRHPVVLNYKKAVLKSFAKSTGKHLCQSIFLNKVAALRPAALFKMGTLTRCFPVNFAKFLTIPFLQNTSGCSNCTNESYCRLFLLKIKQSFFTDSKILKIYNLFMQLRSSVLKFDISFYPFMTEAVII